MDPDSFIPPNGWQWGVLKDLCERVSVGYVSSTREFFCNPGEGVRLVRSQNIRPGRLILDDTAWVTREFHNANPKSQLKPGDILITRVGANAGDVCIVPEGAGDLHCSSAVYARPLPQHAKYLELFCRSAIGQYLLKTRIVGSVSERINTRDAEVLPVLVPPLHEQKRIAHILGTLDDKIERNRRMNATLEGISRAIFKSWFVDFDPVRQKAAGKQPVGMDAQTAALFPDSFEESEIGEVPKGWRVMGLGDVLELAYGKALKAEDRRCGSVPVFGSNGEVGLHDEALVNGPGIVVGRKGNPGVVTWAATDFFPIDTTFYVVPKEPFASLYFLFYALQFHDLGSLGADSAVPGLNRNMAYMSKQSLPPAGLLIAYDKIVKSVFTSAHAYAKQSRTLAALRDTLLPKLLSGEVRVPEAEEAVEEALR